MKTNILKSIFFVALTAGLFTSCVNDDDYNTPELVCNEPNLTVNKTVAQIVAAATASPVKYTGDDVIEGYVVSSDKGGNFFKTLYVVSTDNAIGFSILVDYANSATLYQPGRKIYVNLKDRYIQIKDGGLLIGELDGSTIFRIPEFLVTVAVPRSCGVAVDEETLVKHVTITEATANTGANYLNQLIELDNVQFTSSAVGLPYHIVANGTSGTNTNLVDNTGKSIIVRSTSFSKYAANLVPDKSGSIRGVLTRFGTTVQFTPRYESDIKLTQPRFYINTQVGGSALTYSGTFIENFESYAVNNRDFPKYLNDAYVGSRYWEVKTFGNNKYIQMSSNNSNEVNRTLFFVPVDMTAASTFSFKSKDGFNNGSVLKVYYTTNYTPATDLSAATLVDITSSFTIASGSTSTYAVNFTDSGVFNIPATVTGNGFFIFEYSGTGISPARSTTMQIEDITVN